MQKCIYYYDNSCTWRICKVFEARFLHAGGMLFSNDMAREPLSLARPLPRLYLDL